MLVQGASDVIVIPFFTMSASFWPCPDKTTTRLTEKQIQRLRLSNNFICPENRKGDLQTVLDSLRTIHFVDVIETELFATIRLRPEFTGDSNRLALLGRIRENIQYPISIQSELTGALSILDDGWHDLEAYHVWSKSNAKLTLPVPKYCQAKKCEVKLIFGVFGANPKRPINILFNNMDQGVGWSEKVTAVTGESITLNIPLVGAKDLLSINISIPDATSPLNLKVSSDSRVLGISLQRIELIKL
jgi:hypothetical protein